MKLETRCNGPLLGVRRPVAALVCDEPAPLFHTFTPTMRRQAAAGKGGDRSPHSKERLVFVSERYRFALTLTLQRSLIKIVLPSPAGP
jgi:hypothetical protein